MMGCISFLKIKKSLMIDLRDQNLKLLLLLLTMD